LKENHKGSENPKVSKDIIIVVKRIAFSCALSINSTAINPNNGNSNVNNNIPADSVCGIVSRLGTDK
jgi:hypothetical protein